MTPKESRKIMDNKLKEIVVPEIRLRGFSGSYPHFRRERNDRYEFISFQFRLSGGSFVVEAGHITRANLPPFFREYPFNKLTYGHTGARRRIVSPSGKEKDWFTFENFGKEAQHYELARSVVPLLNQLDEFLANVS